jgi:hypothetical protein
MRSLSIVVAALFLLGNASPAKPEPKPAGALILFGADWCAPCLVELRDLAGLAKAAAPRRIVLAWIDGEAAARRSATLPANVELADPARARFLLDTVARDAAGLPYAVMLDGKGGMCADWRAPLPPEDIGAMRARCE